YLAQPLIERLVLHTTSPRAVAPRADLTDLEHSTVTLFERSAPSVVQVVRISGGGPRQAGQGIGGGTGFVWDAAGHMVTNNHVVEGAQRVAVRLADGSTFEADVVGRAPNYDLAVLRARSLRSMPAP